MVIPQWAHDYVIREATQVVRGDDRSLEQLLRASFPWVSPDNIFLCSVFGAGPWRQQGWKLHVSATSTNACDVLALAIPVLRSSGIRFKVVSSISRLLELNGGAHGLSQVGKFLTLYPSDDAEAVAVASSLDEATAGLRGPHVPSDRALRPGSLVHYRYGAFRNPAGFASAVGMTFDSAWRLTPDYRLPYYAPRQADWPDDPFVASGASLPDASPAGPFSGRFLILGAVQRAIWGRVYDAIDLDARPPRRCVLKEFWHDVATDPYGRDAHDLAALEASILQSLNTAALPRLYDVFERDGNVYLVLEHISGSTLRDEYGVGLRAQPLLDATRLVHIGRAIARAALSLHERGLVHRDLKPDNILVSPSGDVRLIDVAFGYRLDVDLGPPLGHGTPGYMSPAQAQQLGPSFADDVFGWGATLHLLATRDEPLTPRVDGSSIGDGPRRPVRDVRPEIPRSLSDLIDRAVEADTSVRYEDMYEVLEAIDQVEDAQDSVVQGRSDNSAPLLAPDASWLQFAELAGEALCRCAEEREAGLAWPSETEESVAEPLYLPGIYAGAAGPALFLAALSRVTRHQDKAEVSEAAAAWMSSSEWGHGSSSCGLYSGEAGIGLFYLRLAVSIQGSP
jgi:hypothetical protein